jgi:hypothetical protein
MMSKNKIIMNDDLIERLELRLDSSYIDDELKCYTYDKLSKTNAYQELKGIFDRVLLLNLGKKQSSVIINKLSVYDYFNCSYIYRAIEPDGFSTRQFNDINRIAKSAMIEADIYVDSSIINFTVMDIAIEWGIESKEFKNVA